MRCICSQSRSATIAYIDEAKKIVGIRAQPAAIERRQDLRLATDLGVVNGSVGLVPIDVQRPAAREIEGRKRMQIVIVAASDDGPLSPSLGMMNESDDSVHLPVMHGNAVLGGHVDEHAAETVVGDGGEQVGAMPSLAQQKAAVTALPPNETA